MPTDYTWDGEHWVDASGNRMPPVYRNPTWGGEGVNTPESVLERFVRLTGRTLPPMVMQGTAAAGGAAIGALAPPPFNIATIPLGAGIAGGLANVGAKHLPEPIGGEPARSNLSAFMWGALPESVARELGLIRRFRVMKGLDESTQAMLAKREEEILERAKAARGGAKLSPHGAADVEGALADLGVLPQAYRAPGDAALRRQVTFPLRDAMLGPINRMRNKWGEPLGIAYRDLKNVTEPISEREAGDIADAAQGVRDELVAPYPKARAIFERLKNWRPRDTISAEVPTEAKLQRTDSGDYIVKAKLTASDVDWMKLNSFTDEQIQRLLAASQKYKPPTFDELREIRQVVNQRLRTATGGDVHALYGLQHKIDDHLVDHLPDNWAELRANYKSFSDQFRYEDINRLRKLPDPETVADWMFRTTRKPSFVREIVSNSTPAEKQLMQQAFDVRLLSSLNFDAPGEAEFAKLSKQLEPYIRNGTLRDLFGGQAATSIMQRMFLPQHAQMLFKQLGTPAGQMVFDAGFAQVMRTMGADDLAAAQAGLLAVFDALPQADKMRFMRVAGGRPQIPGEALAHIAARPGLRQLSPAEAKVLGGREWWRGRAEKLAKRSESESRAATYAGTYLAVDLAMGRPPFAFMGARLLTAGGGSIRRKVMELAVKTGNGTKMIDWLNARPAKAGNIFAQLLAVIGTQVGEGVFPAKPEPVIGVPNATYGTR